MKIRIFFSKTEEFKYISHLDTIRFFERLFKKSKVDVKYTEGFHPRPKLSFGYPVPLGVESLQEPVDIELSEKYPTQEIKEKLNSSSPKGFKVLDVFEKNDKIKIVEDYKSMLYEVKFSNDDDKMKLLNSLNQETIIEKRRKKRKVITRDLKEKVVKFSEKDNKLFIEVREISPKPIIKLADISEMDVDITRLKYK